MLDARYWMLVGCGGAPSIGNVNVKGCGCKRFSLAGSRGDRHLAFLAILTCRWRRKEFGLLRRGWTGRLSDQSVGCGDRRAGL